MKLMWLLIFTALVQLSYIPLKRGDVLITEVMFNPGPGGAEYVELYNNSVRRVNLQDLFIANVNNEQQVHPIYPLSDEPWTLSPNSSLLVTSSPDIFFNQYPETARDRVFEISRMHRLPNEEGYVVLLYKTESAKGNTFIVLDSLHYAASMHSPFIKDQRGIPLERTEYTGSSSVLNTFLSPPLTDSRVLPGRQKVIEQSKPLRSIIELNTQIIDSKGLIADQDLKIFYHFPYTRLMVDVRIYDASNKLQRHLVRNTLVSSTGQWVWDGHNEHGIPVQPNRYTVIIHTYNERGLSKKHRLSFIVI